MSHTRNTIVTDDAITVPDWRKPVIRMPLTQAFPQFEQVKEFRSKVCLFSEDRTRVFDVVSSRYQLVEHGAAVDAVQTALRRYFGQSHDLDFQIRSMNGGARVRGIVTLPTKPVTLGKNDVSNLTLILKNSYDRSSTFSAKLGAFRLVCSNGMVVGDAFGSITARHVGGAQEGREIGDGNDSILDQLDQIVARAPLVKRVWQEWQDTKLTRDDALVYVDNWLPAKYATPILEDSRWKAGRTKWEFYNDLTHMSTHLTSSMQRRMDFDERIAAMFYDDEFVDAEVVAEED